jgi:hypothetical protein
MAMQHGEHVDRAGRQVVVVGDEIVVCFYVSAGDPGQIVAAIVTWFMGGKRQAREGDHKRGAQQKYAKFHVF